MFGGTFSASNRFYSGLTIRMRETTTISHNMIVHKFPKFDFFIDALIFIVAYVDRCKD